MNKPKVRKVYLKLLSLLSIPFLLSGCDWYEEAECNIPERHVHKYIGSNKKGTVVTYLDSEYKTVRELYQDGNDKTFEFKRQDDYLTITNDDIGFYQIKNEELFKGEDNWEYLYNVMASKHDYVEYCYRYDDGFGYQDRWIPSNKERVDYSGKVRVYHYRFCGHRIIYKDGKWIDERSPFVDDIREIIDDYPYFQLDPYMVVHKDYTVKKSDIPKTFLDDVDEFTGPDLENKELYTNKK